MNSTKLHSLSLAGRRQGETTLGGFGLQRWRARRRIKEKETAAGPEDLNWARAKLNAKTKGVSAN